MPSYARKDIVREGEVGTYHCWSRVVQRAFLCGYDPETGRDFGYRRAWIEGLLAYQASVFALDVGSFNVLSNHAHTILRTRPDIAASWSHEDLALRWKMAWPDFDSGQWFREPQDQEIEALLGLPEKLEEIRCNLSSLSWFMARWKEPIARLCNAEMDRTGHFWEARFGSRELLDDAAVLACSIYVDLNQVRAGMADSLEDSYHSSIRNRILAAKRREAEASREEFERQDRAGQYLFTGKDAEALFDDCWLSPICSDGPLLTTASLPVSSPDPGSTPTVAGDGDVENGLEGSGAAADPVPDISVSHGAAAAVPRAPSSPSSVRRLTRPRASDSPILDVPWSEYLRVLVSVAALTSSSEAGTAKSVGRAGLDGPLDEVPTRWGIRAQAWLAEFQQLDYRCTRALGSAHRMLRRAGEVAQRWFHGIGWCREIFVGTGSDTDAFT